MLPKQWKQDVTKHSTSAIITLKLETPKQPNNKQTARTISEQTNQYRDG